MFFGENDVMKIRIDFIRWSDRLVDMCLSWFRRRVFRDEIKIFIGGCRWFVEDLIGWSRSEFGHVVKTFIGVVVAGRIGLPFVELDRKIEEKASLSLSEIFALHGEDYYRRL